MSERLVVLLRGVNVGGVTVRSADLRTCLTDAGFTDVRTVLASGNALVTAEDDAAAVTTRVQEALHARYEREVRVIVRPQAEVAAIAAACPYAADSSTHHAYVIFFSDVAAAGETFDFLSAALPTVAPSDADADADAEGDADADADESLALGDGVVYWWCPRGSSLSTPVSKASTKVPGAVLTTTRNLRTVLRLVAG